MSELRLTPDKLAEAKAVCGRFRLWLDDTDDLIGDSAREEFIALAETLLPLLVERQIRLREIFDRDRFGVPGRLQRLQDKITGGKFGGHTADAFEDETLTEAQEILGLEES
jgi:hypothetical protein